MKSATAVKFINIFHALLYQNLFTLTSKAVATKVPEVTIGEAVIFFTCTVNSKSLHKINKDLFLFLSFLSFFILNTEYNT